MELHTITEDRTAARRKFLEYRNAVRERHNAEDEQIMRGYREMARGRQLILLPETLAAGGTDARGLPRLAVSDAHEKVVHLRTTCNGSMRFLPMDPRDVHHNRRKGIYGFPAKTLPEHRQFAVGWRQREECEKKNGFRHEGLSTVVPNIPPSLRPAHGLHNYTILWEVDEWAYRPRPPARDPALLRRIGGDLYAVLALWEVTELERAVLGGRA